MNVFKLLVSVGLFALGTPCLVRDDAWMWFGVIMWVMALASGAWIIIGGMWRDRAEYFGRLAELLHEAKEIDAEKLRALGVFDVVTKIESTQDETTRYYQLPARPLQLKILAAGVLEGVPFSRRAWAEKRDTFTQGEWFKLQEYCRTRGLIVSEGRGYKPSDEFMQRLAEIVSAPLPHQQEGG